MDPKERNKKNGDMDDAPASQPELVYPEDEIEDEQPSQAEGDRETINEDLKEKNLDDDDDNDDTK